MSTFGERLRDERVRLGLSQSVLGERCGVKKGAQINYEKGERAPDADYLIKLAEVGADVPLVLFGKPSADGLSAEEERLLVLYRLAEPGVRKAVLGALATGEVVAPEQAAQAPRRISEGGVDMVVHGNIGQRIKGGTGPNTVFMGNVGKVPKRK